MMSDTERKLPTPQEFYLEYPLYKSVDFDEAYNAEGLLIYSFSESIDSYCPSCRNHSVFLVYARDCNHRQGRKNWFDDNEKFDIKLHCSRNSTHKLYFLFQVNGRSIQKIGQFPSLADLSLPDMTKYAKVLNKDYFKEFKRAIGLAAHDVGVGSFVYLRRIFESLIEEARKELQTSQTWDEEAYQKSRMAEKIQLLSDVLPKFLVDNKSIYGILSKGIHELSEDECLNAFPLVKVGIEIILDAKLEEIERKKKIDEAQKALQKLSTDIS